MVRWMHPLILGVVTATANLFPFMDEVDAPPNPGGGYSQSRSRPNLVRVDAPPNPGGGYRIR